VGEADDVTIVSQLEAQTKIAEYRHSTRRKESGVDNILGLDSVFLRSVQW